MKDAALLLGKVLATEKFNTPTDAVNFVLRELHDSCFLSLDEINELYTLAKKQFENGFTVKYFLSED